MDYFLMGAVTSWDLVSTVWLQWRLQEGTVTGQEMVQYATPCKTHVFNSGFYMD